jgi:hypothetical protein
MPESSYSYCVRRQRPGQPDRAAERRNDGGEGGIRTPGTLIRGTHDFQSCTFNRSVTSPLLKPDRYGNPNSNSLRDDIDATALKFSVPRTNESKIRELW